VRGGALSHPIAALALVVFLLAVVPAWGWLDMRRLKRHRTSATLTRSYLTTVGTMWLLAIACALLVPTRLLWAPSPGLAASMQLDRAPRVALIGVAIGILVGLAVPVVIARRRPEWVKRQLEPIRFLLPMNAAQGWLFALVCVTAGLTEEWIYRGFLLRYLGNTVPGLNGWWIVLIASAMFGIAHVYQGKAGTVLTAVLGFVFSVLYIGIGSLLVPMILHTLLDLRIFLLISPELRAPAS
jgi:membrane protease YdiL (CAAX protease family)